jgi:antitoxin HicB
MESKTSGARQSKRSAPLNYPVTLEPDDNGTVLVGFPDFPEANSVGDNEAEALQNAVDALETAIEMYIDARKPVPLPSAAKRGQRTVALPALPIAKVLLWNEMHAQGLRKADLARALHVNAPLVDRLFNLRHSSKIEFVEQAAAVMGKSIQIALV